MYSPSSSVGWTQPGGTRRISTPIPRPPVSSANDELSSGHTREKALKLDTPSFAWAVCCSTLFADATPWRVRGQQASTREHAAPDYGDDQGSPGRCSPLLQGRLQG